MKKSFLALISLVFVLSACGSAAPATSTQAPAENAASAERTPTSPTLVASKTTFPSLYQFEDYGVNDCVGIDGGAPNYNDLVHWIAADEHARVQLKLSVYTADYMKQLEKTTNDYANKTYGGDMMASSVCHLNATTDVVGGFSSGKPLLFLVSSTGVRAIENLEVQNSPLAGDTMGPCRASLENAQTLKWKCYQGPHYASPTAIDGVNIKYWLVPLDGSGTPQMKEDLEQ